jgi:hypothetical protein
VVPRPLAWCGCLLLGLAAGFAAVLIHQRLWGLALGIAAAGATAFALPAGGRRFWFAVGCAGTVVAGAVRLPAGDFLIAANGPGYTVLTATFVLLLAAVVTAPGGRRAARPPAEHRPTNEGPRLG